MEPLLSVIIPTYNCRDVLEEAAGSVLEQLPENCELIIVDDGSSDGTADKLQAIGDSQENLRIYFSEHQGASGARNRGLDLARGRYVAFLDCDDCIRSGFLGKSVPMTGQGADLYIFGIERVPLTGNNEYWTVKDGVYDTAGDFADEYIRTRQLLVYSNCNKFYRRDVIEREHLRFDEDVDFGEDRLFNFDYLSACSRNEGGGPCVITSSLIMLRYIQRNEHSMSSRQIPGYFSKVMQLHEMKMRCFFDFSKGTTEEEKLDFEAYDLSREVEKTIERFPKYPEEKEENLPLINALIFGGPCDMTVPVDALVILGSRNCGYKVDTAFRLGGSDSKMKYIVSGGNLYLDGTRTEAEFMADRLRQRGIADGQIYLENRSRYTKQNLEFSNGIVHELGLKRIGIVTGGFHIPRTRLLAQEIGAFTEVDAYYFPAYGPTTHIDTWFEDPMGLGIVLEELRKTFKAEKRIKGGAKTNDRETDNRRNG